MEKVTGIGGVFFRAKDPEGLAAWYERHLGVPLKNGCAELMWRDGERPNWEGRTVWSTFEADTEYFGPAKPAFMINYLVASLDRMLEQLRSAGITIEKVEDSDYGRFAWITDPEGNRIELYEPK